MTSKELQLLSESYDRVVIESKLDQLQTVLDAIGLEPTVGTGADIANAIISGARAIGDKDKRKEHLANMAISLVSTIPFADVVKLAKKPYRNAILKGAKAVKNIGKEAHTTRGMQATQSLTGSQSQSQPQIGF